MSRLSAFLALMLLPVWTAHAAPDPYRSVWECDAAKFSWYCDEEEENKPAPAAPPAPAPKPPPKTIREMTSAEEVEKEMKRLLGVATMAPTEENVKAYALALEYIKGKAGVFSDVWRRLAWQDPELFSDGQRPTNTIGRETFNAQRDEKKLQSLAGLAKTHGLFFFFKSDCPYCHKMAPLLKLLQARHGLEIFPVSLNGKGLPEFPKFEADRGMANRYGVDRVPALFLANKSTGDVLPVSFGIVTLNEIEERIYVLTNTKPGDEL